MKEDSDEKLEELEKRKYMYTYMNANTLLKQIFYKGCSIKAYCDKYGYDESVLVDRLKKLKDIAEHARKKDDTWIPDKNFLKVIETLESQNYYNPSKEYILYFKNYIKNNICEKGAVDLIRYRAFDNNGDLMTFILNAYNIKFVGYDENVMNQIKKGFEGKVNKYFARLSKLNQIDQLKIIKEKIEPAEPSEPTNENGDTIPKNLGENR